jgi:hypothetical protein
MEIEKIQHLFKEDVKQDNLEMKRFLKENNNNNKNYFYFPIFMLLEYKKQFLIILKLII